MFLTVRNMYNSLVLLPYFFSMLTLYVAKVEDLTLIAADASREPTSGEVTLYSRDINSLANVQHAPPQHPDVHLPKTFLPSKLLSTPVVQGA